MNETSEALRWLASNKDSGLEGIGYTGAAKIAHMGADEIERLTAQLEQLSKALGLAIEAAWDGPSVMVGSNCEETYQQWKDRLELECKAALSAGDSGDE